MSDLEGRIRALEDREQIRDLVVLYGFAMDERDLDAVRRMFCPDAVLRSPDGVFAAHGIEQVVAAYSGRYDVLGPTNHVSHGHLVRLDPADPDRAIGLVSAHAEVVRHGTSMVVALRYEDVYRRLDGRWRFAERVMSYLYYLPVDAFAAGLGDARPQRADAGDPRPADWPWVLTGAGDRLAPYWKD